MRMLHGERNVLALRFGICVMFSAPVPLTREAKTRLHGLGDLGANERTLR
jgi:hypothetical protein